MGNCKKILVKPELKTVFLKNGDNEKVTYLNIPKDFCGYSIYEDMKKGAKQFTEIKGLMEKSNLSKVVIISADNLEMGLMAVTYLAMYDQEVRGMEGDLPFDVGFDEFAHSWYESRERIPIISVEDITNYIRSDGEIGIGEFLFGQKKEKDNRKPFWVSCISESVCLIVDRKTMSGKEFDIANLFAENRHIFVIFLENGKKEDDEEELMFGIMNRSEFTALKNSFILSYMADEAIVSFGTCSSKRYYTNIIKQNLKQRGITIKRGFSYEHILNLACSTNKESVCEMIDKIINYAIKDFQNDKKIVLGNNHFKFIEHFLSENVEKCEEKGYDLLNNNLVGIDDIKQQVQDIVNVMKYHQLRRERNILGSNYHNVHVMLGAPGTAKTTVAKYMGQMMFDEKLLPDNRFICVNGAELKGMYVGHSAPKTKALFEKYDVIIIDEAYSIVESGGETDSFGNEAIAQLIIELEKHSTDKLVIFAGYGGECVKERNNRMKDFLDANPGIKSRITSTFYFKSYNADDMVEIFMRLASNGNYKIQDGTTELVKDYFANRVAAHDFGNGREARALLENATLYAARRLMKSDKTSITDEEMMNLTIEDVSAAIEKMHISYSIDKRERKYNIGFTL